MESLLLHSCELQELLKRSFCLGVEEEVDVEQHRAGKDGRCGESPARNAQPD